MARKLHRQRRRDDARAALRYAVAAFDGADPAP